MGRHSECKVDSTYKSVIEQTGIQAGEEGYHINVGGRTVLDGAAIASTADPSKTYFRTGSLEWNDIVNEAMFKATQARAVGFISQRARALGPMRQSRSSAGFRLRVVAE